MVERREHHKTEINSNGFINMTDARAMYEQHLEKGHVPPELLPPSTEKDLQRDAAFDEILALGFINIFMENAVDFHRIFH